MKIIYNSKLARIFIPSFKMILIMFILFCKKGPEYYSEEDILHEETHSFQWKSVSFLGLLLWLTIGFITHWWWGLLIIPFCFYIYYGIEWFIRFLCKIIKTLPLAKFGFKKWLKGFGILSHEAYRSIVFEQEARAVENKSTEKEFLSFFLYY